MAGPSIQRLAIISAAGTQFTASVCSLTAMPIDRSILSATFANHLQEHGHPDWLVLLVPSLSKSNALSLLVPDGPFFERWPTDVAPLPQMRLIHFLDDGSGFVISDASGKIVSDDEPLIEKVRVASLQDIFVQSGGMEAAPDGLHFAKTSRAHSTTFLRASNVLHSSANAFLIGFWLLPFLNRNVRKILVDTSPLLSVAFALVFLARDVRGEQEQLLPEIVSHGSYEGLAGLVVDDPLACLSLISASTSGGLAKTLQTKIGLTPEQIVTLFYLGQLPPTTFALCDLRQRADNPSGLKPERNFLETDCKLCADGSVPIKLFGDQFQLEPPKTCEVELARDHLDARHRSVLEACARTGIFRVNKARQTRVGDIELSATELIEGESKKALAALRLRWSKLVRKDLPAHLDRIVVADGTGGEKIAEWLADIYSTNTQGRRPEVIMFSRLRESPPHPDASTVVVAGCVDEEFSLTDISIALRQLQPLGNVTYIAPFSRAKDDAALKRLKSNISFGSDGAGTFPFHPLHSLILPPVARRSPWDEEQSLLDDLISFAVDQGLAVDDQLRKRAEFLRLSSEKGLSYDLFWPTTSGQPLRIRPDFVYIDTNDSTDEVSDADVYVVVSSILNGLRLQTSKAHSLHQSNRQICVLSPRNFERFNDGIIHAALLRAAEPAELNFARQQFGAQSRAMSDVLKRVIKYQGEQIGEAAIEFLLALASGKLRLHEKDLRDSLQPVIDDPHSNLMLRTLAKFTVCHPTGAQ